MKDKILFRISKSDFDYRFRLAIACESPSGISAAEPIVFKPIDEGAAHDSALKVSDDSIQQLIDELWRAGARPSKGISTAGQLEATQDHLSDMRKLVSKTLDLEL